MKRLTLVLTLTLFALILKGQSFQDYGKFYFEFEQLIDQKDDFTAEELNHKFDKITYKLKFIPTKSLLRIAEINALNGNVETAKKIIDLAIRNGLDDYQACKFCDEYDIDIEELLNKTRSNLNISYKRQIDSMSVWDQCTRTKSCKQSITYVDSSNMVLLLSLIEQYGFPSENVIGSTSADKAIVMILHFDRDKSNKIWGNVLKDAFGTGKVSPRYYAWIKDRRLAWGLNKEQYYHFIPTPEYKEYDQMKLEEIQLRRDSIGLRVKHKW